MQMTLLEAADAAQEQPPPPLVDTDARPAKRVRFSTVVSSNDVTHLAIGAPHCCCWGGSLDASFA